MDMDTRRALWKIDNYLEMKKLEGYKAKAWFAIKCMLLTPIVYLDRILLFLFGFGMLTFTIWFMSLIVRALLKYLGE